MRTDHGFVRVAAAVPVSHIGNPRATVAGMLELFGHAVDDGVQVIVYPELQLAGAYSYARLFHDELVRRTAVENLQRFLVEAGAVSRERGKRTIAVVGMPLVADGQLFNVAVVCQPANPVGKQILCVYVKTHLAGRDQFREPKFFAPASQLRSREVVLLGERVPIGADLIVVVRDVAGEEIFRLAAEICEDLFVPDPPSSSHALAGATIIVNPSASNDLVGKDAYRVSLVENQSARTFTAYVYTSVGSGEATGEVVFSGRALIAEAGTIVARSEDAGVDRYVGGAKLIIADIDVAWLERERTITPSFGQSIRDETRTYRLVETTMARLDVQTKFLPTVNPRPFVPSAPAVLDRHCSDTLDLQVAGLVQRLRHVARRTRTDAIDVYLGLSGGLDSAHALTVAVLAYDYLKWSRSRIHAYVMPGYGTDERTYRNALLLCKLLNVTFQEHRIDDLADLVLAKLGHEPHKATKCLTCQNVQARMRTLLLMTGGFMIGTGDFSELAKNYCTYSGDDRGMYCVNTSVAKTFIKFLVGWYAGTKLFGDAASAVFIDIGATPISAGLVQGQRTEDEIGPYDLTDFAAFHFRRNGFEPAKIAFLAGHAYGERFSAREILQWLRDFYQRVIDAQFKINAAPDGPKIGSVSWSHHTDWYAPSDMEAQLWLDEIDRLAAELDSAESR